MTTFEREYRELDRLKGVSLKDNVLLYKITPEAPEGFYWAPPPQVDHLAPAKAIGWGALTGAILWGIGWAIVWAVRILSRWL